MNRHSSAKAPRLSTILRVAIAASMLLGAAACSSAQSTASPNATATASASTPAGSPTEPGATPSVPATTAPSAAVSPLPTYLPGPSGKPSTTDTGTAGKIWDALPATFPIYPGIEPLSPPEPGAWSASLGISNVSAQTLGSWYAALLQAKGYAVTASPALEGGARAVSAIGTDGCTISMSFQPRDTITVVLVQYGATCAFE